MSPKALIAAAALFVGVMQTASADDSLLVVRHPDAANETAYSRADLEALSKTEIRTTTVWTDGVQSFDGPLVRDVLPKQDLSGLTVFAVAMNDYTVEIPAEDFATYDVILAMRQNGKQLSVRDKGPIWIVYPRDDHPELQSNAENAKWIWQLKRLELR